MYHALGRHSGRENTAHLPQLRRCVVASLVLLVSLSFTAAQQPITSQNSSLPSTSEDHALGKNAKRLVGRVAEFEREENKELLVPPVSSRADALHVDPAASKQAILQQVRRVSSKRPLNLVYMMNPRPVDQGGNIYEADWIQLSVLASLDRPVRVQKVQTSDLWGRDRWLNDTLIVYLYELHPKDLLKRLRRLGLVNLGVYHMGDELRWQDIKCYADADFVLRNYWFDEYRNLSHTHWVPLGVRGGLSLGGAQTYLPASKRKHFCNFIGSLRADREQMVGNLTYRKKDCVLVHDRGWASPNGIHPFIYRQILLNSRFTLAPFGNNEESMRFYEALEAGSIPITEESKSGPGSDFIADGLGNAAFLPRVKDWGDLPSLLKRLDENPEEIDRLQEAVLAWWGNRKVVVFSEISSLIEDSFTRAHGNSD